MFFDFETGFSVFGIMFVLSFIFIIAVFIFIFVKIIGTWSKNNRSPRLSVTATVVTKRADIRHGHSHRDHIHTSTSYYVTFQVESGDRIELYVPFNEYGILVEGDYGILTFQGTRYLSFDRKY